MSGQNEWGHGVPLHELVAVFKKGSAPHINNVELGRHGRLEFPHLRQKLIALAGEHKPNRILVEQAGPGLHLIQDFTANPVAGVPMPIGIKPEGDKMVRMEAQSARFEAGQVHLPKEAPWLSLFLHEMLVPMARHDDQIDSVSQFLNWAETYCRPMSFGMPYVFSRPREGWFDYSRYYES